MYMQHQRALRVECTHLHMHLWRSMCTGCARQLQSWCRCLGHCFAFSATFLCDGPRYLKLLANVDSCRQLAVLCDALVSSDSVTMPQLYCAHAGTTGNPKGVMLTHNAVVCTVESLKAFLKDNSVAVDSSARSSPLHAIACGGQGCVGDVHCKVCVTCLLWCLLRCRLALRCCMVLMRGLC